MRFCTRSFSGTEKDTEERVAWNWDDEGGGGGEGG